MGSAVKARKEGRKGGRKGELNYTHEESSSLASSQPKLLANYSHLASDRSQPKHITMVNEHYILTAGVLLLSVPGNSRLASPQKFHDLPEQAFLVWRANAEMLLLLRFGRGNHVPHMFCVLGDTYRDIDFRAAQRNQGKKGGEGGNGVRKEAPTSKHELFVRLSQLAVQDTDQTLLAPCERQTTAITPTSSTSRVDRRRAALKLAGIFLAVHDPCYYY